MIRYWILKQLSKEIELILLGGSIVCCFNLITSFTDWTLRNSILGVMMQLNWLMKPNYPNISLYGWKRILWQSSYSPNVDMNGISKTIASDRIIYFIDDEIILFKPLSCLQSLNDRHLSHSHPSKENPHMQQFTEWFRYFTIIQYE